MLALDITNELEKISNMLNFMYNDFKIKGKKNIIYNCSVMHINLIKSIIINTITKNYWYGLVAGSR